MSSHLRGAGAEGRLEGQDSITLLIKITAGEPRKDSSVSDANEQMLPPLPPPWANEAQSLIGIISSE